MDETGTYSVLSSVGPLPVLFLWYQCGIFLSGKGSGGNQHAVLSSVVMALLLSELLPWQGMPEWQQIVFAFQLSFPHKRLLLMSSDQQDINDWYLSLTAAVR